MRSFAAIALLALVASASGRRLRTTEANIAATEAKEIAALDDSAVASQLHADVPADIPKEEKTAVESSIVAFGTDEKSVQHYCQLEPNMPNCIARKAGIPPADFCEKVAEADRTNEQAAICDKCFNAPPCAAEPEMSLENNLDPLVQGQCPALIANAAHARKCAKYARGGSKDLGINLQVGLPGRVRDTTVMSWRQLASARTDGLEISADAGEAQFKTLRKELEDAKDNGLTQKQYQDKITLLTMIEDVWANVLKGVRHTIAGNRHFHSTTCDFRTACHGDSTRGYASGNPTDGCKCHCSHNFGGDKCEFFKCSSSQCSYMGSPVSEMVAKASDCKCNCKKNYVGDSCEFRTKACSRSSCSNHGEPVADRAVECECKCDEGYSGATCNVAPEGTVVECKDKYSFCSPGFMCMIFPNDCDASCGKC